MTTPLPEIKKTVTLPEELRGCTTFLLAKLGYAIKMHAVEELERAGFNLYHYSVLAVLGESARETQATIADALGVDRSQLVGILDTLEEQGLIERRRDPNDRRRHMVTLTAAGRRELVKARAVVQRIEDAFLAGLDEQERVALHDALLRVATIHNLRFSRSSA
jgi:DNA-binding MarR family transcriptional regulator